MRLLLAVPTGRESCTQQHTALQKDLSYPAELHDRTSLIVGFRRLVIFFFPFFRRTKGLERADTGL